LLTTTFFHLTIIHLSSALDIVFMPQEAEPGHRLLTAGA
jgi:hypothetical protein